MVIAVDTSLHSLRPSNVLITCCFSENWWLTENLCTLATEKRFTNYSAGETNFCGREGTFAKLPWMRKILLFMRKLLLWMRKLHHELYNICQQSMRYLSTKDSLFHLETLLYEWYNYMDFGFQGVRINELFRKEVLTGIHLHQVFKLYKWSIIFSNECQPS